MKQLISMIVLASGVLLSLPSFAQTCLSGVAKTKPDTQYTINGDNTVSDSKTDLVWMRCSLGQDLASADCTGTAETYNWQTALQAAQNANGKQLLGHTDWRLPSIAELRTITEKACYSPAINETIFPATMNEMYWSSSPDIVGDDNAWTMHFYYGFEHYATKDNNYYVRLVRGGQ